MRSSKKMDGHKEGKGGKEFKACDVEWARTKKERRKKKKERMQIVPRLTEGVETHCPSLSV